MVLVVVVEPSGDPVKRGLGIRHGADAEVIALEGLREGLAHADALGARDRREARDEVELGGEDAGIVGGVDRAVVREPFHRLWRANPAKAHLDGFEHHVADVGPADPCVRDGAPGDHLAVVGVENEGAPDDRAIPAGKFEAVGTPAQVGAHHHDLAVVDTTGAIAAVLLQEQSVDLHQPVDPFVIGWGAPFRREIAVQQRGDAPVA